VLATLTWKLIEKPTLSSRKPELPRSLVGSVITVASATEPVEMMMPRLSPPVGQPGSQTGVAAENVPNAKGSPVASGVGLIRLLWMPLAKEAYSLEVSSEALVAGVMVMPFTDVQGTEAPRANEA